MVLNPGLAPLHVGPTNLGQQTPMNVTHLCASITQPRGISEGPTILPRLLFFHTRKAVKVFVVMIKRSRPQLAPNVVAFDTSFFFS